MILIVILLILLSLLFWLIREHQSYFKKKNVKYLKSPPFVGCLIDVLVGRKALYDAFLDIYNTPEFKDEPFFGIFMFHKPALIIKDPELIKKLLVTDFKSFGTRYAGVDVHDPLGYYELFLARYPEWKQIRPKLTPFFSSAKLKNSYYLIDKLGNDLIQYFYKRLGSDGSVVLDIKNVANFFFVDVVSSIAFGIEAHILENSESEMMDAANSIFTYTFYRGLEFSSTFVLPQITKIFNFMNFPRNTVNFLYKVCPDIIAQREKSGIKRNDMIDTLIELKKVLKPTFKGHTVEDMLYAQAAVFLAAGFETSSITASFTFYELSKNQEIQDRLRAEIKNYLAENDGKFSYESVANNSVMPYLHQVMNETMRMYSLLPALDRKCIDPNGYSLEPLSNFKIPFGMPVFIPIYGLERDEKYFPNPLKYDPDRFAPENIANIPSYCHIPFGIGPRYCLGERLGWIQTKTALCNILKEFRVELSENTPKNIKLKKNAFLIQPEKPLMLKFVKDPLF
jgi:cytochrome P450 family 6